MLDEFQKRRYVSDVFVELDEFLDPVDPFAKRGCFGGGKGGGGGGTTYVQPSTSSSTQVTEPWSGVQPYLKTAYSLASNAFQTPIQYFPGDTFVPMTGTQQQALGDIANRAESGSPTMNTANNQLQSTLGGNYLYSNPAFNYLGGAASGQNVGSNVGYDLMGGIAQGQNMANNPVYNLLGPTAQGAQTGTNPANYLLGGMAGGQYLGSNPANYYLNNVASGVNNAYNPGMADLTQAASYGDVGSNVGYGLLSPTAQGAYLNSNPYLDQMYTAATDPMVRQYQNAVAPGIDSTAERAGRYGSDAYQNMHSQAQQNLAKSLGDTAANIYGQNYAQERGLQQSAQNQLSGLNQAELARQTQSALGLGQLYQGGTGQQVQAGLGLGGLYGNELNQMLGAGSTIGSLYGQDLNRQLQAAQGVGAAYSGDIGQQLQAGSTLGDIQLNELNQQLQAGQNLGNMYNTERENMLRSAVLAPTYAQNDYTDLNQLYNVGAAQRSEQQQQLADQIARYNFGQLEPRQSIAQYLSLLYGGSGLGGAVSSSGTSTTPLYGGSALSSGLGGAIGGGALGSMLGINPLYGALGGGLLGGLFG